MNSSPYLNHQYFAQLKASLKPLYLIMQRFFLASLICAPLGFLSSCVHSKTSSFDYSIAPKNKDKNQSPEFMRIKILSSIALSQTRINSLFISELSGIAWDEDEQILYAVSDEGLIHHLKLTFDHNKIIQMEVIYAARLKDKKGKNLKGKYSDSEGLSLLNANNQKRGDSKLIIAFENKPRIGEYSPTGELLTKVKIPNKLTKKKNYRSKNKALESVTVHPTYGYITAAEYPLKKDNIKYQTLYATSNKSATQQWHFNASAATNSAVTGLETMPNGDILVLERAYKNPITPIVINLRQIHINNCNNKNECKSEVIASLKGIDGWSLDNFEGLTHLRGNQYLMISDNNGNPLQNTILVHFEILKKDK